MGCEGCGAVATISELDQMYERILVNLELRDLKLQDQLSQLHNKVDTLTKRFEKLYPAAYKYQD